MMSVVTPLTSLYTVNSLNNRYPLLLVIIPVELLQVELRVFFGNKMLRLVFTVIYNITAAISRARRQNKSPPDAFITMLEAEKAAGKIDISWSLPLPPHRPRDVPSFIPSYLSHKSWRAGIEESRNRQRRRRRRVLRLRATLRVVVRVRGGV
jgi:hypothetical protein